jgi:hypothetical protein
LGEDGILIGNSALYEKECKRREAIEVDNRVGTPECCKADRLFISVRYGIESSAIPVAIVGEGKKNAEKDVDLVFRR